MNKDFEFKLRINAANTSNADLLNDIKSVADRLNKKSLTQKEYQQFGHYSIQTYHNRFGSWSTAKEEAGLIELTNTGKKIADAELFNNLEIVWRKLGKQPTYSDMKKPLSFYRNDTYCRRFGSWHEACLQFLRFKKTDLKFEKIIQETTNNQRSRHIPDKARLKILKRDAFKCVFCGKSPAFDNDIILHIDHIVPFSKGGSTQESNLQTLCHKCNLGKNNDESVNR